MKRHLLTLVVSCTALTALAQDIRLTDSVIYFENKPVAYYVKELNQTTPHYNVYVISMDKKLLIAAQVTEFEAPVRELKPFYYYNLIFKDQKDTIAIYHEGQAFTLELATLLKQYHLLDGNKINRDSLTHFKKAYNGNALLLAKIKEFETYLNENRFFNEQVIRDRTKPVTIVNDKIIMQDGKKIGIYISSTEGDMTFVNVKTSDINSMSIPTNNEPVGMLPYKYLQVMLTTERVVDASKILIDGSDKRDRHDGTHPLYDRSYKLNKTYSNEAILWAICQLVENYLL